MTQIEKNREKRKYLKGDIHTKALTNLEKQKASPFVEVQDPKTGQVSPMKKCVADILESKKQIKSPSKTFSVPHFPEDFDWSK